MNQGGGLPARDFFGEGGLGNVRRHIDGADGGTDCFYQPGRTQLDLNFTKVI